MSAHPIDELFRAGATVYGDYGVRLVRTIGTLDLGRAALVLCDPAQLSDARPALRAPSGRTPKRRLGLDGLALVRLALVRYDRSEEVAAVRIDFGASSQAEWRRLRKVVGIDSATACVTTATTAARLATTERTVLERARARLADLKRPWLVVPPTLADAAFLFKVHDDGAFSVFEARDRSRRLVSLAVAFARRALSQEQERRLSGRSSRAAPRTGQSSA